MKAHKIRWEMTFYEPVFRELVNESLGVFQSLVKQSRQYRSIMKDCQEQLESLAETVSTAESSHNFSQSNLLYKLELI